MLLKDLCELNGVSGNEKTVREYILQNIKNDIDHFWIDRIGNLITEKKSETSKPIKVLLCAHMDEVGLFITDITAEGYLKFQAIGGIDPRVLISKSVISSEGTVGVIGLKAIHLQKSEERKQSPGIEELYIDIGANTKEEAEKVIKLGDYIAFQSDFNTLGPDLYKAKALDDRVGCAVIMELLSFKYDCNLTAAFTVQEEIGLRGSKVISNYIQADLAVIIEATTANDFEDNNREDWIVELGKGPACSLMDSATIYKPDLIAKVTEVAANNNIPLQFRLGTAAANDSGNIHLTGEGMPTITISIPCRNIHSPVSVIAQSDYENCLRLVKSILDNINNILPIS